MTVSAREVERLFPSVSPGLALYRRVESIVQPSATTWMHHLEVRSEQDLDGEVIGWLKYKQA